VQLVEAELAGHEATREYKKPIVDPGVTLKGGIVRVYEKKRA